MAGFNPFRKFRDYRKYALAALGIMAMISFVIFPMLMMNWQSNAPSKAETLIATCRQYGNVDVYLVQNLQQNRSAIRSFYNVLAQHLMELKVDPRDPRIFGLNQLCNNYSRPYPEEELIHDWLLRNYAIDMGIVVSDKTVVDHLNSITGGLISTALLDKICQESGLNSTQLVSLFRDELLTMKMNEMFSTTLYPLPPMTRWNYYQRIHRSLEADVAAIPVEQFVSEVKKPSDAELKKFFEENKHRVYNPAISESGFMIPTKIAFQVIDATPSEEILASITKEDITKFYEENKEKLFRKELPKTPTAQPQSGPLGMGLPGANTSNFGSLLPSLGAAVPAAPATEPSAPAETPVTTPTPAAPPATEPATTPAPPAEPQKDQPAPITQPEAQPTPAQPTPAQPTPEPSTPPKAEGQSKTDQPAVYRNAVYQQETTAAPAPTTEPVASPAEQQKEQPAPAAPVAEIPANAPATPAPTAADAIKELLPENSANPTPPPAPAEASPEATTPNAPETSASLLYFTQDEMESVIRQILAAQKVEKSLAAVAEKMREFYNEYSISSTDNTEEALRAPNLETLAQEHHLKVITAALPVSVFELQNKEYWKSESIRAFFERIYTGNIAHFDVIEGREGSSLQQASGRLTYLGWVTQRDSEKTPEYTDEGIAKWVQQRWTEVQARKLALKKAEELADLANKSQDKPLREVIQDQNIPVVETERFSWFTMSFARAGNGRSSLMYGEVCEKGVAVETADFNNKIIKAPGDNFMEKAYSLQVKEAGAAFNQPESVAYVIRIKDSAPPDDLLWKFFSGTPIGSYAEAGFRSDVQQMREGWIQQIENITGFTWVKKPQWRR